MAHLQFKTREEGFLPYSPYGYNSTAATDNTVSLGELCLVIGKDPVPLLVSLQCSETLLFERASIALCLGATLNELIAKMLSSISGVDIVDVISQRVPPYLYPSISEGARDLHNGPLLLYAPKSLCLTELEKLVIRAQKGKLYMIFVNDILLLRLQPRRPSTSDDAIAICERLRAIAHDHDATIFGSLATNDLTTMAEHCDVVMRIESLDESRSRLGIQRGSEPQFHLVKPEHGYGRLSTLRPCPWPSTERRFAKAITRDSSPKCWSPDLNI